MFINTCVDRLLVKVCSRSNSRVNAVRNHSPKSRRLRLESLENRELLSASTWGGEVLGSQTASSALYESQASTALETTADGSFSNSIDGLLVADGQNPEKLSKNYVFSLNSLPTSTYTIYLDFNGHTNSGGTYWQQLGKQGKITTPAYSLDSDLNSFSNKELRSIYEIWLRVSEDFAPFNVNVTTAETSVDDLIRTDKNDSSYGVRVCIGGRYSDWYGVKSAGGGSYVGSFTANSDTPAYVFSGNISSAKIVAETISHEVGHSLGLEDDGDSKNAYYYGANGWAPIMGVSDYQTLSQWSKGEYAKANNKEDDLKIITTKNGFGYRSDDVGDSTAKAKTISVDSLGICTKGVVERNTDVDFFKFNYNGGNLNLYVGGIDGVTNLDALVKLYNASGKLLQTFNPTDSTSASIEMKGRVAGTYYLSVEGTGLTLNGKTIYTDYASLGQYMIVVTSPDWITPPSDLTLGTYDATTRRVSMSWKDNSSNATGFRVEFSTDGGKNWTLSEITPANVTSRVAKGIKTNAEYIFRVCAVRDKTYSEWTYSEPFVPLVPPSDITFGTYDATTRRVSMSWKDNSSNETGFRVEFSTDGGKNWTLSEIVGANVTSRVATGIKTNAEYVFRVCAVHDKTYSAWTYSKPFVPLVPPSELTLGTYDATTRRVSMRWKDNSSNETGFRVEFSKDGGKTWTLSQIMGVNATSRVATGVQKNAKYSFRVCAIYGDVYSDWTYSETLDTSVRL